MKIDIPREQRQRSSEQKDGFCVVHPVPSLSQLRMQSRNRRGQPRILKQEPYMTSTNLCWQAARYFDSGVFLISA